MVLPWFIGIDAWGPGRGGGMSVAALRYVKANRGGVFRIDASGVIRGHVRKLEEAEDLFRS